MCAPITKKPVISCLAIALSFMLVLPFVPQAMAWGDQSLPEIDSVFAGPQESRRPVGTPTSINQPTVVPKGANKLVVKWAPISNAKGYRVQIRKNGKWKTLKTIKSGKKCTYATKKLEKDVYYCFRVQWFTYKSGAKRFKQCGKTVGSVTRQTIGQCNASGVSASRKSVSIKHGNSKKVRFRIVAKQRADEKLSKTGIRFASSNPAIAYVTDDGTIVGKHPGKCMVYAIAHNGKQRAVKVAVKPNAAVNPDEIPIFTFHRIVPDEYKEKYSKDNQWTISLSTFEKQIAYIHDNGFTTISLRELEDWYDGRATVPGNSVVITFDDGYYEDYYLAYPVLKKYGMKATSFVVGALMPKATPAYKSGSGGNLGRDIVARVAKEYPSISIQSHSWDMHVHVNDQCKIYTMTRDEILADFAKMKQEFGFEYMAFPYGAYTNNARLVMPQTGIRMAFAFSSYDYATKVDERWQIRRIKLTEASTEKVLERWLYRL